MTPLRVAILAHSTHPRGGVVHALELGAALTRLGHRAVVHAPDPRRQGFFRDAGCATVGVAARPAGPDLFSTVETRVADYLRHFETPGACDFDVFHAQDGLSGNALAALKASGRIAAYARTVHHLEAFTDPRVAALEALSIRSADALFTVGRHGQAEVVAAFGRVSVPVGNGVDIVRFSPRRDGREPGLRERLGLGHGPVYLAVGGIEERKNSVAILEAFLQVHSVAPGSQLVIAGGVSLLDHRATQDRFARTLLASGLPAGSVLQIGPVADAMMPALYRSADALVFPSLREGFGLVVLEAMACGLPVVVSRLPPFTDYLQEGDAVWCDPHRVGTIADAMMVAVAQPRSARGRRIAARHGWDAVAGAHRPVYERLRVLEHA